MSASQYQQWITIDECVSTYLLKSEQSSATKGFKITHIAFDGMKELGLDFFFTVRSVKLPVNANFTVSLPDNYLNWSKVGVFNDRGEIIPLIYNEKLAFFADQQADRVAQTDDSTLINLANFSSLVFYNYFDGNIFDTLYGLPSGGPFVGNFKIDNNAGLIVLDQAFQYPYIVLEYIGSPTTKQGMYFIPMQFKEALVAYMAWKDIQYIPSGRRGNAGDKEQRRREFYNERRLARLRYRPFRMNQAYEENLRQQRLAVKA